MGRCSGNATTAAASTSAGSPIEVSFVVVDPPALTRCIVDCPDLSSANFRDEPPLIVGADGAFLLIIVFSPKPKPRGSADIFLYKSGPGKPSLELLPEPYPVGYNSNCIGVLSCRDYCLVIVYGVLVDPDRRMNYILDIFSNKTGLWSTKVARQARRTKPYFGDFDPTKSFAVGGGSMAWVDLWNGILLFDCVTGDPEVRRIQLPPLMPVNAEKLGVALDAFSPVLDKVRDVTCSNGWFRFIEIGFPQLDFRWKAAMFKMMISSDQWEPCDTADSAELSPTSDSCFPRSWEPEGKKLTLNNMLSSFPTLDVYNDNIVYMTVKMKDADPSGWVLSVNTENKKLEKISSFSEERFHFFRIFRQSDFSKHIREGRGTHLTKDLGGCTNRQKIELLETILLDALSLLRNIDN